VVPGTLANYITAPTATVSLWVYPMGTAPNNLTVYNGHGIVAENAGYFGLYRTNMSGPDQLWAYSWSSGASRIVGVPYTVNAWTYITIVHSGGTLSIYKNGVFGGSVACPDTDTLTGLVWLGRGYGGVYFQGRLDDCRFYNRALSASEVWRLYQASRLRYPNELRWRAPLHVVPLALAPPSTTATTGTVAVTQADQTLSSTAALSLGASLSATQDVQSLSTTAALTLRASLTQAQEAQSLASTGTLSALPTGAALGRVALRTLNYANPVNLEAPLNRGLVSWWQVLPQRLGGVRLLDLQGKNHLTLTNMGASGATSGWGATTRPGGMGELRGDGSNDYLTAPLQASMNLAQGTVAVWTKRRSAASGEQMIVSWGDGSVNGDALFSLSWPDTTNVLRVLLASAGAYVWRGDTSNSFGPGLWWYVAVSVGPAGNSLFVNGVPQTLTYANGSATSSAFLSTIYSVLVSLDVGRLNCVNFPVYYPGAVDDLRLYNRALAPAEVRALYQASRRRYPQELRWRSPLHLVPVAAEVAGAFASTGTVSVTQADQTLTSVAALALTASATVLETADSLSATAALALLGSVGLTQAAQTLSTTATVALKATLAQTAAADTLTSASTLALRATSAQTQADQTLSATGIRPALNATLSVTQGAQTVAATSTLALRATSAVTQAADTLSASGGATPLTATLSVTQAAQTLTSTAALALKASAASLQDVQTLAASARVALQAVAAPTQAAQTLTATATVALTSTVALTQADQTLSATGIRPALSGTLTLTQATQTLASSSTLALRATLSQAQADQTLLATGVRPALAASLSLTQAAQTVSATSTLALTATVSQTQADMSLSATGVRPALSATLSSTQADQTLSASSALALRSTVTLAQDGHTLAAVGGAGRFGVLASVQAPQTLSASAAVLVQGTLSVPQAAQTLSSAGTLAGGATLAVTQASQAVLALARLALRGTLSQGQEAETLSAAGQGPGLTATLSLTQAPQTLSASGEGPPPPPQLIKVEYADEHHILRPNGTRVKIVRHHHHTHMRRYSRVRR
jgi:Concanavalin A-like lectin/glucanases superfamily